MGRLGVPRYETTPPGVSRSTSPHVEAHIPCLRCGRAFGSVDRIRNRLCPKCNTRNSREVGRRAVVSSGAFLRLDCGEGWD